MFARTERLLLRPGWAEDAPALFAAIADEGVVRNLARAPWPYALADAEAFLAREGDPRHPASLVFARTRGAPRLIGVVGISPADDEPGAVELGYWVARPHWGLGYATEAARAMTDFARLGLGHDRIVASHYLDNPASARVLTKLGFQPTGCVRPRFSAGRGEAAPAAHYALVATDTPSDPPMRAAA